MVKNIDFVCQSHKTLTERKELSMGLDKYVDLAYHSYLTTCKRNNITPLPLKDWKNQDGSLR